MAMFSCPPDLECNSPRGHVSEFLRNRENPEILEFLSLAEETKVAIAKRQSVILPKVKRFYKMFWF